jgi:hypothetical protein
MITHLDRKMYQDAMDKEKEKEENSLEIDTDDAKMDYIKNNDIASPTGFDTSKLNAMKFSSTATKSKTKMRRSSIIKNGKRRNSRAQSFGGRNSKRAKDEQSIADSDSEEYGNSLKIPKRGENNLDSSIDVDPSMFRSHNHRRLHKRNKSVGGFMLSTMDFDGPKGKKRSFKRMSRGKRNKTIQLLELEKMEIERRILMIKTKKRQKMLKGLKNSASPST